MKPFRVRLNDDEFVDEIRISTVPRFKTSGLSGDEWRHSIEAVAYRKGREIGRRSWNKLKWALPRLQAWIEDDLCCPVDDPAMAQDLCDQPGCSEPWSVMYRLTIRGCGQCGNTGVYAGDETHPYVRVFCDRHAHRGDSDLDDMDEIYQPIEGAPAQEQVVRSEDESPSVFGGFVDLRGDPNE